MWNFCQADSLTQWLKRRQTKQKFDGDTLQFNLLSVFTPVWKNSDVLLYQINLIRWSNHWLCCPVEILLWSLLSCVLDHRSLKTTNKNIMKACKMVDRKKFQFKRGTRKRQVRKMRSIPGSSWVVLLYWGSFVIAFQLSSHYMLDFWGWCWYKYYEIHIYSFINNIFILFYITKLYIFFFCVDPSIVFFKDFLI